MFDDFRPSSMNEQSQLRFGSSMAVAMVLYLGGGALAIAATATVRKIVEDDAVRVEFAPPPEPEPPPPEPVAAAPPKPNLRPKVKRPELAPPDKISDEKLKESNKALAAAGEGGPVDGFLDGAIGGTGTGRAAPPPPAPKVEALVGAVGAASNDKPKYSPSARRKGIEGTVVVEFDVLEDGRVANARIVSGPTELHEMVLRTIREWHFRPAHRGAQAVRSHMKKSIVFRLEDA
jgi:protein TonB